ncbi:MAG: hypothetical protein ACP5T4_00290 [Candidatus Micrarchaeia archaeon]
MDLWSAYQKAKLQPSFGKERLYIRVRDRIHLSLSSIAQKGIELGANKSIALQYNEYNAQSRYIIAKGISFDLMLLVYDVNTSSAFAFRATQNEDVKEQVKRFMRRLKRPNIEIRAIGMQNSVKDYGTSLSGIVDAAYNAAKPFGALTELDLFGTDQRNIAIDIKLGMSFDILLFDRFYKPGELANATSIEQFKTSIGRVFPGKAKA